MKDHKNNKSETTAVKDMKEFQKASSIMESIAEAGSKEYLQESAGSTEEASVSKDGKADWASLTKIDVPALNESFEPRFADTSEKLSKDDEVLITRSMKKYLAESVDDYIPLNRIPGMSVVIANDTGLSPIAVEEYIDTLINEAPGKRDSQQKVHEMSGRVDGAADTTKNTVPEPGEFPGDANEEPDEIMPSDVVPGLEPEAPEVVDTEPEFVAPEEPVMDEEPIIRDEPVVSPDGDIDMDLAELDAELSKEIEDDSVEAEPEVELGEESLSELEEDDATEEEIEKLLDEDEKKEEDDRDKDTEEEEESFMESLMAKKEELSKIRAKFESVANKYENVDATNIDDKDESALMAQLESIADRINTVNREADEVIDSEPSVSAKLESIREDLANAKAVEGKLESIRSSILESVNNTEESPVTVEETKNDAESITAKLESIRASLKKEKKLESILESIHSEKAEDVDYRKDEIKKGLDTLTESVKNISNGTLMESEDVADVSREEKIERLKARFESKIQKDFDSAK